jgi:hypothetical protein
MLTTLLVSWVSGVGLEMAVLAGPTAGVEELNRPGAVGEPLGREYRQAVEAFREQLRRERAWRGEQEALRKGADEAARQIEEGRRWSREYRQWLDEFREQLHRDREKLRKRIEEEKERQR